MNNEHKRWGHVAYSFLAEEELLTNEHMKNTNQDSFSIEKMQPGDFVCVYYY